jgi:DNA-binding PadR family transcriptional regulator
MMTKPARPANPLALAVLALLFERAMHPYEMAATLKDRHKEESIKLRYGSLYAVIEILLKRGDIAARETSRSGNRPERTVYELTPSGLDELRDWMRDLLRHPAKEFTQFEAGLSLLPVLPPDEAVTLLRDRALHLSGTVWKMEGQLAELSQQELGAMTRQDLPAEIASAKFPPLFVVENEFRLAMVRAELAFVTELVRRITEEGWGPVGVWRNIQQTCASQHESYHAGIIQ